MEESVGAMVPIVRALLALGRPSDWPSRTVHVPHDVLALVAQVRAVDVPKLGFDSLAIAALHSSGLR